MTQKNLLFWTNILLLACLTAPAAGQDPPPAPGVEDQFPPVPGAEEDLFPPVPDADEDLFPPVPGVEEVEEPVFAPVGQPEDWLRDYVVPPAVRSAGIGRFGYWATTGIRGNRSIIGKYEDLSASPFWDVDGIVSDGVQTLDFSLSQLTNEIFDADIYYYRPGFSAEVEFDRFRNHRGEKVPEGFSPEVDVNVPLMVDNMRLRDDMVVRVEEIRTHMKGQLTPNLRWHFDFYNLRRHGQRQVTSMAHCFDQPAAGGATSCHLSNQSQRIDWNVAHFEPGLEWTSGPVTINYTRDMRIFSTDDESVTRTFNRFGEFGGGGAFRDVPVDVGLVPEAYAQFDKLKIRTELTDDLTFFGSGYFGNARNRQRNFARDHWGYDLRLTNRISRGLTVTGYYRQSGEHTDPPPDFFAEQGEPHDAGQEIGGIRSIDIRNPVDYNRIRTGLRSSWRPYEYITYGAFRGVVLTSGYEYSQIARDNVTYLIRDDADNPFTLRHTQENMMYVEASKRWNPQWQTFTRYRLRIIDDPMLGLRLADDNFPDDLTHFANTSLPEYVNQVDVGGTWMPATNLMLTAQVGIENRGHSSDFAEFREQTYPMTFSAWYAPAPKWNFTGGMGFFTNWIDQDITVGILESDSARGRAAHTDTWQYGGRVQMYHFGARYAWTPKLSLHSNVAWSRGANTLTTPVGPDFTLATVDDVTAVIFEQTRLTAGVDYAMTDRASTFFQYVYRHFRDLDDGFDSGRAHMFLGGLNAVF